jgi:predicted amino acid-binding ACT domain protein
MDKIIVVVVGSDKRGIIARFSSHLYELNINIEDVQQKVMDGIFVMTLLADISQSAASAQVIRKDLEDLGNAMGLKVMVHNEAVLKAMHRV